MQSTQESKNNFEKEQSWEFTLTLRYTVRFQ